jgi:hypothetical protein
VVVVAAYYGFPVAAKVWVHVLPLFFPESGY